MIPEEIYNVLTPIINIYGDALGWVNEDFEQFKMDYREDVTYTGQTISLEKKLNDLFDTDLRRINIQDGTAYNAVLRNRNETGAQTIVVRKRSEEPSEYFILRNRSENVPSFIVNALDFVPNELGAALNNTIAWVLTNCSISLTSGNQRLRFTAVRRNLVNNSDASIPNWSGVFNVPRRVVWFATGVNMTFPNFTVSNDFDAIFVVEVLNSSINQVLLKDSATNFGFYKESTTAGNRLALNFGGSTICTVNTLAEGWHRIELNYNNTTGVWGIKVNNVVQAFVDGLNTLSINGRVFSAVTSSVNQFTGKIAELSISGFAWWKFVEGALGQSFDTLNANRLVFSGSFAWVNAPVNSVIVDYIRSEGYSQGVNLVTLSNDLSTWASERILSRVYDSNTQLWIITEDTSNNSHRLIRTVNGMINGNQYNVSIYVKAKERSIFYFQDGGTGAPNNRVFFNVLNQQIVYSGGSWSNGLLIDEGNGIYRATVVYTPNLTFNVNLIIGIAQTTASPNYQGNGLSGIFLGKLHFKQGVKISHYQPTTTINLLGVTIPKRIGTPLVDIFGNPLEYPTTMYYNSALNYVDFDKALVIKTPNANMSLIAYGGVPYGGFVSGVSYRVSFYYASASLESGVTASANVMLLIVNNTTGNRSTVSGGIANPTTVDNTAGAITNIVATNFQNGVYKVAFTFVPNFTSADAMLGVAPFSNTANVAIVALGVQVEEGLVDTAYQSIEDNHFDFSARTNNDQLLLEIGKTYNFELNVIGGTTEIPDIYASASESIEDALVTIEDAIGPQSFQVVPTTSPTYLIVASRAQNAEFVAFSRDFSVKEDYDPLNDIKNVLDRYRLAGTTFEIR